MMALKDLALVALVVLLAGHQAAAQSPESSPKLGQPVPAVLPWGNLSQALQRVGADSSEA
jgi:hypothetical protein